MGTDDQKTHPDLETMIQDIRDGLIDRRKQSQGRLFPKPKKNPDKLSVAELSREVLLVIKKIRQAKPAHGLSQRFVRHPDASASLSGSTDDNDTILELIHRLVFSKVSGLLSLIGLDCHDRYMSDTYFLNIKEGRIVRVTKAHDPETESGLRFLWEVMCLTRCSYWFCGETPETVLCGVKTHFNIDQLDADFINANILDVIQKAWVAK